MVWGGSVCSFSASVSVREARVSVQNLQPGSDVYFGNRSDYPAPYVVGFYVVTSCMNRTSTAIFY
jgi:hypothetical protein